MNSSNNKSYILFVDAIHIVKLLIHHQNSREQLPLQKGGRGTRLGRVTQQNEW